jgi:hypothetical protein
MEGTMLIINTNIFQFIIWLLLAVCYMPTMFFITEDLHHFIPFGWIYKMIHFLVLLIGTLLCGKTLSYLRLDALGTLALTLCLSLGYFLFLDVHRMILFQSLKPMLNGVMAECLVFRIIIVQYLLSTW